MPEVSITHQTVGIHLPRLRCGAIGWRTKLSVDGLTAEKVFGWKNVDKHEGSLVGSKQDKAGR
jgi:hypothetical protein